MPILPSTYASGIENVAKSKTSAKGAAVARQETEPERAAEDVKKKTSRIPVNLEDFVEMLENLDVDLGEPKKDARRVADKKRTVVAPAPVITPQQVTGMPMAPTVAMEASSQEGTCDHIEHVPAAKKPAIAKVASAAEKLAVQKTRHTAPRYTAQELRQAVITSEILDRPISLRPRARMRQENGRQNMAFPIR